MSTDNITKIKDNFLQLIKNGEKDKAVQLILKWAEKNSLELSVSKILEPALLEFGIEWGSSNDVSLGQGYILSKVTEEIFKHLLEERTPDIILPQQKGPIVIGNIVDDNHSLGRKLLITFLEMENWKIYDMGNDVEPDQFIEKAMEVEAPIIAVSAMMLKTAQNISDVRELILKNNLEDRVKLAVGGAVFCQRPELVKLVGGDGTAINAIKAISLMESLLEQVKR